MKRVLVTGSDGFIGQCLTERLRKSGWVVRMMIHSEARSGKAGANGSDAEVVCADIRDSTAVRRAMVGIDSVFHLASKVHDVDNLAGGGEHDDITVKGTTNLMNAVREAGTRRVVFMSSLSVYGTESDDLRDETVPCVPASAYGRAKLQAEGLVLGEGRKLGIHVSCLRPAMVYGIGCKGNLLRMIQAVDRGFFPPLPRVSNRRNMVHVSDVVEAAILTAASPAANGQCYIVTDGRPYATHELYEMICRGLGKSTPEWHVPLLVLKWLARVGDGIGRLRARRFVFDSDALEKLTGNSWFSSEKVSRELGYRPRMTFEDALPGLIAWYRGTQARLPC